MDPSTGTLTITSIGIWGILGIYSLGLLSGIIIGWLTWHRRTTVRQATKRLTQLQVVGIILTIFYLASPLAGLPDPNAIIAIALLALVSGEAVGASFAQILERYTSVTPKKEVKK